MPLSNEDTETGTILDGGNVSMYCISADVCANYPFVWVVLCDKRQLLLSTSVHPHEAYI